jgi:hypothetical protein
MATAERACRLKRRVGWVNEKERRERESFDNIFVVANTHTNTISLLFVTTY